MRMLLIAISSLLTASCAQIWYATVGSADSAHDLVVKLSQDFVAALNSDEVKARLAKLWSVPIGSTPEDFNKKIHADYDKWGPIIKAAGIKAE